MLLQSNSDKTILKEALENLKQTAKNEEYSNRLLVLGSSKGSVADLYIKK